MGPDTQTSWLPSTCACRLREVCSRSRSTTPCTTVINVWLHILTSQSLYWSCHDRAPPQLVCPALHPEMHPRTQPTASASSTSKNVWRVCVTSEMVIARIAIGWWYCEYEKLTNVSEIKICDRDFWCHTFLGSMWGRDNFCAPWWCVDWPDWSQAKSQPRVDPKKVFRFSYQKT